MLYRKSILPLLLLLTTIAYAQSWTQMASIPTAGRAVSSGFVIGNKGYLGLGGNVNGPYGVDFWEWDQATNIWTQKANFPGAGRATAVGWGIGNFGYFATGTDLSNYFGDLHEYDPILNTWTPKASMPSARGYATGFSLGTQGYVVTGYDALGNMLNDLWEWDQATNAWTQKASMPGAIRCLSAATGLNGKGYVSCGLDIGYNMLGDFWEWDQATNTWTQKPNYPGAARHEPTAFAINNKVVFGTGDANYTICYQDLFEFDPTTNAWAPFPTLTGAARELAVSWVIGCAAYISCGWHEQNGTHYNDLWEIQYGFNITLNASATNICSGTSVTLTAAGGPSYIWNTGATTSAITVTPTSTTTYFVASTNGVCTSTQQVTINVSDPPNAQITGSDSICPGTPVTLTCTGGTMFNWSNGSTSSSITVSPATTTTYTVVVNSLPCPADTAFHTVFVHPPGPVILTSSGDVSICEGTTVQFVVTTTGGAMPYSYQWSTLSGPDQLPNINAPAQSFIPTDTGTFQVIVTDLCGNRDTIPFLVEIKPCSLYIPNVITPNGDPDNQFFAIKNLHQFPNSRLVIYSRWGNLIYESANYLNDWEAKDVSNGTYYFILYVSDGRIIPGWVMVLDKK